MVLCHGQHIITIEFDFISLIIYDFDRSKRIRRYFFITYYWQKYRKLILESTSCDDYVNYERVKDKFFACCNRTTAVTSITHTEDLLVNEAFRGHLEAHRYSKPLRNQVQWIT